TTQDWYAQQLEKYHARRYRAYVLDKETADRSNELGRSAARVPKTGYRDLPEEVRAAHAFYRTHFEETDLGSAQVWRFTLRRKTCYAVLVTTDGDDGFAEFYDQKG